MVAPIQSTAAAVKAHPAGTFGGSAGVLFGYIISVAHLSNGQVGAIVAAIGLATAFISYANAHGGIRGLFRELLSGSSE